MKIFWAFLALLLLIAAVFWFSRSAPAPAPAPIPAPQPSEIREFTPPEAPPAPVLPTPAPTPTAPETPEPDHADLTAALLGDPDSLGEPPAAQPSKAVQKTAQTPAPGGNPKLGPAKIERRDDGTMLVDDRFVISGKGTKESPYQITWEFLTSAQETYQPRLGMKNLPDRLNIVNNKWVTVAGYIAFPLMAETPDEMLMMLNQWDGCCIGVPPTPYDALEVKLSTSATREQRLAVDGTVSGVIRVDPYLVKDWLVSMYLMDDARLVQDSASGPEKNVRDPGAHVGGAKPEMPEEPAPVPMP